MQKQLGGLKAQLLRTFVPRFDLGGYENHENVSSRLVDHDKRYKAGVLLRLKGTAVVSFGQKK